MPQLRFNAKRSDTDAPGGVTPENAALLSLIRKAARGDAAALYDLCAESMRIVYFLALRLMGNKADAEDVMQESLLRMCQKIGELRDPEAFASWLSRITTNEARAFHKKNAKRGVILDIDDYVESVAESSADFLPEEYAENEENREAIVDIIDTLPMRQREAVVLCYYGGLSVTEAAAEMGIEKANVSQYLKLARRKLKAEIETRDLAPEGGAVTMHSMGFPAGLILLGLLRQEASLISLDREMAEQALQRCGAAIQAKAAPMHAGAGSVKAPFAPTVMMFTIAVTVAVTFFYSMLRWPRKPQPGLTAPVAAGEKAIESAIVFAGGEESGGGNAYRNPVSARLETAGGAVTVTRWWITPSGDEDTVLYQSAREGGAGLADALEQLRAEGGGMYVVWFRLQDEDGFVYRQHRSFRVG